MNTLIMELLNALLISFETAMLIIMSEGFFRPKRSAKTTYLLAAAFVVVQCAVVRFTSPYPVAKVVAALVVLSAFVWFCYRAELSKCLFTVVFLTAYFYGADNALLLLIMAVTKQDLQSLMGNPYAYYLLCYGIKATELFGIVVLSVWARKKFLLQFSGRYYWLRVLMLPMISLLLSFYLLRIYSMVPSLANELLFCSAVLLIVDLMAVFLLNHLEQQQTAIHDNVILKRSIKQERDNISAWKDAYSSQRKLTHDFQNQLSVISGMVRNDTPKDEMLSYISRLTETTSLSAPFVNANRSVVDIILNQKHAIAQSKNIKIHAQLDDLAAFPMADDDLVIVLSNLIDNAVEECENISDREKRYVLLKIKMEKQAAFLYIENPTSAPVMIRNNQIIGTKKNSMEHGYGLKNIVSVLERYEAIYALDWREKDSVFSFALQLDI